MLLLTAMRPLPWHNFLSQAAGAAGSYRNPEPKRATQKERAQKEIDHVRYYDAAELFVRPQEAFSASRCTRPWMAMNYRATSPKMAC